MSTKTQRKKRKKAQKIIEILESLKPGILVEGSLKNASAYWTPKFYFLKDDANKNTEARVKKWLNGNEYINDYEISSLPHGEDFRMLLGLEFNIATGKVIFKWLHKEKIVWELKSFFSFMREYETGNGFEIISDDPEEERAEETENS